MLLKPKYQYKYEVSVIIPNWNGRSLLKDCLGSLQNQSYKNFEIILVENGSTDGSGFYIERYFPKVRLIKLDRNYGFAKAINTGVLNSQAKYVVFLNNDTVVEKAWLMNLVKTANARGEVVSVNPKLLQFFDRTIMDGAGIEINEVGQARSIGWNQKDCGQFEKESLIFGATGGASLFRRKEFVALGMFDEDYFMYSEEVDFAFRAQFMGFKSIYCPEAVVYHKHKATAKKLPGHIEYWQFKNMTVTIIKDFPASILFKKWRWLKIILVHLNTIFYQLKKGYFWPPIFAEIWLIFHLAPLLVKRKKIQSGRKVSDEYIETFLKEKKITYWGLAG